MTCRDVMTSDPSTCLPYDSVATAAQIMKRQDVGPIPVVSDHTDRRLIGIVTDRDLAINVVAEGRDPHSTRIDEVMSPNPVTCREDDDVSAAIQSMADYQIRRIPVLDSQGRLTGIIAQADVARYVEEEEVGEMVEEISQPYGQSDWPESHRSSGRSQSAASALAVGAVCLGAGAALMYILDPTRGRKRRSVLQDKATSYLGTTKEAVRRRTEDLRNRAKGAYVETRKKMTSAHEQVPDEVLEQRVRSKMGRHVSNPHAVEVRAHSGHVTVSGPILADEVSGLISSVRGVPGVHSVENLLEVHQERGSHPSLQGHSRADSGWGTGKRILSTAVGGGLMLYGLKSRGRLAKAGSSVGLGLLAKGITNREFGGLGDVASWKSIRRGH